MIASKYAIQPEHISKYIPAEAPLQVGAISAGNMNATTAFVKLSWILSRVESLVEKGILEEINKIKKIKELFHKDAIGELDKVFKN